MDYINQLSKAKTDLSVEVQALRNEANALKNLNMYVAPPPPPHPFLPFFWLTKDIFLLFLQSAVHIQNLELGRFRVQIGSKRCFIRHQFPCPIWQQTLKL